MRFRSIMHLTAAAGLVALTACTPTPPAAAPPAKPAEAKPTTAPAKPAEAAKPTEAAKPAEAQKPAASGPTVTLSVAAAQPDNITASQAVKWFGDQVEARTSGRVKFQYHWGGSLTKPGEELDATSKRLADMTNLAVVYYPAKLELANWTYAVPFGPPDPALLLKITRQMYDEVPELRSELESNNLKLLFYMAVGTNDLSTQKPVQKVEDLQGLKVGAVGKYLPKALEAVGAVPVVVPAPEKYQSLQTGIINADMQPFVFTNAYKLHEINKYLIGVNFGANYVWTLTINNEAWASLPPDVQKIMQDTALEAEAHGAKLEADGRDKALEAMKAAGATYMELPAEERQRWAAAIPNLPQEWVDEMEKQGKPGRKIMQQYIKLVADSGYKWPRTWEIK